MCLRQVAACGKKPLAESVPLVMAAEIAQELADGFPVAKYRKQASVIFTQSGIRVLWCLSDL